MCVKNFAVKIFDGTTCCVVTTDTDCLLNKNAAAVLGLQANFRFEYAPQLVDKNEDDAAMISLLIDVDYALQKYVTKTCEDLGIDLEVFRNGTRGS